MNLSRNCRLRGSNERSAKLSSSFLVSGMTIGVEYATMPHQLPQLVVTYNILRTSKSVFMTTVLSVSVFIGLWYFLVFTFVNLNQTKSWSCHCLGRKGFFRHQHAKQLSHPPASCEFPISINLQISRLYLFSRWHHAYRSENEEMDGPI